MSAPVSTAPTAPTKPVSGVEYIIYVGTERLIDKLAKYIDDRFTAILGDIVEFIIEYPAYEDDLRTSYVLAGKLHAEHTILIHNHLSIGQCNDLVHQFEKEWDALSVAL